MITNPHSLSAYNLLHEGILALHHAEQAGFRVDLEYIEKSKSYLTRKIDRLESELKDTKFYKHWEHVSRGKINIHSDVQLANFLYKFKGLKPPKSTTSGQGSTDEESLKQLEIPELDILLEVRKLKKIRDTYLEGFERECVRGYIHPFFNLNLVKTFRSSSDRPNLQNIPVRDKEAMNLTRQALYPRPGHQLLEVDFKGLEVGIGTCYHKDPTMLKYLNDPTSDMHRDMAKQIFMLDDFDSLKPSHKTLRSAAKNGFVFPEFYGDYYGNCAYNMAFGGGGMAKGRGGEGGGKKKTGGDFSHTL